MKIIINLRRSKGDLKSVVNLFKEVEELAKKYPIISDVDMK